MNIVLLDKNLHDRSQFDCGVDALNKLLSASKIVGFPLIIVDAKDGVSQFYLKYGFIPFKDKKNKLFIPLATYQSALK